MMVDADGSIAWARMVDWLLLSWTMAPNFARQWLGQHGQRQFHAIYKNSATATW